MPASVNANVRLLASLGNQPARESSSCLLSFRGASVSGCAVRTGLLSIETSWHSSCFHPCVDSDPDSRSRLLASSCAASSQADHSWRAIDQSGPATNLQDCCNGLRRHTRFMQADSIQYRQYLRKETHNVKAAADSLLESSSLGASGIRAASYCSAEVQESKRAQMLVYRFPVHIVERVTSISRSQPRSWR